MYEGQVQDGRPHGIGKMTNKKGELQYEGQVQDGKPHGIGKRYNENKKIIYEGEFQMEDIMVVVKVMIIMTLTI